MKKYIFILFVCVFANATLNAQNISGEVLYDLEVVEMSVDTSKMSNSVAKASLVRFYDNYKKSLAGERPVMKLNFNKDEAVYQGIPSMQSDAHQFSVFYSSLMKRKYYTSFIMGLTFKQTKMYGTYYRVLKNKSEFEWEITSESKEIAGYKCYKATTKKRVPAGLNTIEAWFAPSLPFSFGPDNYGGLPGLVLEMKRLGVVYRAVKVKLKDRYIDIKMPTKGKLVNKGGFQKSIGFDLDEE